MEIHQRKTLNLHDVQYDKEGNAAFGLGVLKEPVVCIRPGHKSELPQIYSEILVNNENKLITHNYGHSGVGYSLLFGSVEKAIESFQIRRYEVNLEKVVYGYDEEITIVGLGCIGLVTALTLYFRGYKNIRLVGEKFLNTPSIWAGGLIEFSLSTIYEKENIAFVNELFKHTFKEYQQIVKGSHKFIKYGIKEVDYYTDYSQEGAGLNFLADLGIIAKGKKVILKLGNSEPRELYHFRTFNVSTYEFMTSLMYTIKKLKIPVEYKKINNFKEIKSKIIFNCSGLGSRELNNDTKLYPICGHGMILSDEAYADHGYILRLSSIPELNGTDENGPIYFMPKSSGFIGGTYMKDYDGKDEKTNKDCINKLLERSKYLFNNIKPVLSPKF
jgi:D-amino-acid oxidase